MMSFQPKNNQCNWIKKVHLRRKTCKHNRIDVDFFSHKLAIEIDKNDHSHRNIDYEIKKQKAIKQELGCKFITIDPEKKEF